MELKDELHEMFTELASLRAKAWVIEKFIREKVSKHRDETREIQAGTCVAVFDCNGKNLGVGVVAEAAIFVDTSIISGYVKDADKIQKDLDYISYEVFAIKKDGTVSTKHFFQAPHYMRHGYDKSCEYYIETL